jgi:hypothetical protein
MITTAQAIAPPLCEVEDGSLIDCAGNSNSKVSQEATEVSSCHTWGRTMKISSAIESILWGKRQSISSGYAPHLQKMDSSSFGS